MASRHGIDTSLGAAILTAMKATRTLIVLAASLMIVGCTTPKDSVVGTYAGLWGNIPSKLIFHDEGIIELANDSMFGKWTMVGKDKEVEVDLQRNGEVSIFRINPDGSITNVGYLTKEGKRINWEGLTSSRTFRKKE